MTSAADAVLGEGVVANGLNVADAVDELEEVANGFDEDANGDDDDGANANGLKVCLTLTGAVEVAEVDEAVEAPEAAVSAEDGADDAEAVPPKMRLPRSNGVPPDRLLCSSLSLTFSCSRFRLSTSFCRSISAPAHVTLARQTRVVPG